MIRIPVETPPEDEWDPQGLNSLAKEELESFSSTKEEEEVESDVLGANKQEEVDPSDDLDRDGLRELEDMERQLQAEEPMLDFAMIAEEE